MRQQEYAKKIAKCFVKKIVFFLFFSSFLFFLNFNQRSFGNAFLDGSIPSYSWPKSAFGTIKYWEMDPPNILFLIDTSGSMTFDKYDTYTYGDGSLPWWKSSYYPSFQYYWGKDTDATNNNTSIESNYHPLLVRKGVYARSGESANDLIPNDSRLYILRNVMYRLLQKEGIMEGINVAIGTYSQVQDVAQGDWYYDFRSDSWEYITWKGSNKGMKLRQQLVSAIDPSTGNVRQELLELFDGTETSTNGELRADGSTPLAASIYPEKKQKASSAYDFFHDMSGNFDGICQANWVVVMTDGEDTASNSTPHEAVKNLYDKTSNLKTSSGDTLYYPVRTMVIGFINSKDMPTLRKELDDCADIGFDGKDDGNPAHAYYADNFDDLFTAFEEIVITIKEMSGRKSPPAVRAGLPGTKGDVYVPEMVYWETKLWEGILEKYLLNYDSSMSDTKEWESSFPSPLERTVLTVNWHSGGSDYAGTNLAEFTASNWKAVVKELGIRYALSGAVLLDEDDEAIEEQTKCFIRWYRGEEPYCSNWSQRESLMADMDRSGMAVIGPPQALWGESRYLTFKKNYKNRPERLYIQSSEGMLHCFDTETGLEKWAFIPPQSLRWARIAGLRASQESGSFWEWAWYGDDSRKSEQALPREILGGPLVAEDVLLGSGDDVRYATVLLCSPGYGGYGLYALEITDPAFPRFLWAIENAAAVEPEAGQKNPFLPEDTSGGVNQAYPIQSVFHWAENGDDLLPTAVFRSCATKNGIFRNIDKTYLTSEDASCSDAYFTSRHLKDYKSLGFILGKPYIGRVYLDDENDEDSLVFLGFVGGGLEKNLNSASSCRGCAIYAFGMNDGRLYAAWGRNVADAYSFSDSYLGVHVADMGMVYAPPSVKVSSGRTVEHLFVPDSKGYIRHIIFAEDESLALEDWKFETPVYLAPGGTPLAIPYQMPIGKIDEALWLFGGTKNVSTPSGNLANPRQYILGIKVSAYCGESPCGDGCTKNAITMANLKNLDADDGDAHLSIDSKSCGYEDGAEKFWGWQIPLVAADSVSPQGEYVSAAPALSDMLGRLFVATFEPYAEPTTSSTANPCEEPQQDGKGRLYILNAENASSDWPGSVEGKYVEFEGINITGLGVYDTFMDVDGETQPGTRVVLTFLATQEAQEALQEKDGDAQKALEDAGMTDISAGTDGMLSGFVPLPDDRAKELGFTGNFENMQVVPIYWKNN